MERGVQIGIWKNAKQNYIVKAQNQKWSLDNGQSVQ